MSALDAVLAKLENPKKAPGGWKARCPSHEDRTPSLTIAEGKDGRVLLKCFAGCELDAILAALGLETGDLFKAREVAPRTRANASVSVRPRAKVIEYKVCDPAGVAVAIHERRQLPDGSKRMTWKLPDGRIGLNGMSVASLPLYGSERATTWTMDAPVFVTEGEKAAEAMIEAGLQAVGTVTGASTIPDVTALEVLAGCNVVLWPDNDEVGRSHMQRIGESLLGVSAVTRVLSWPAAPDHGDAADFLVHLNGVTVDDLVASAPLWARVMKPGALGMDAADLLDLDLPPLRWVLPDIVPEGTTVLAAPPKIGKSCLVYQLAVEAAIGGELLGRRVQTGSVLYLALEDGQRRGKERLRAVLGNRTMPRGRLEVRWSAKPLGKGLEDELTEWLDEHPDAILVAIDTLQRVRPVGDGRRNAYEVDVADLGRLQNLFRNRNVALLVVHHSRKATTDDFLASVSGTYGITGSADTTLVIKRGRIKDDGVILVTGRDVAEAEIPVRFANMTWTAAPSSLSTASFERAELYRTLLERGPMFALQLSELTGRSRTSVQNMMTAMTEDGSLVRTSKGYGAAQIHGSEPPYVPHDSSDYESHSSHGTHARAREADPEVWWNKDA